MTTPFQATQSFVPTQIPGCQLWFDAADQTTFTYSSGSNISQWRDKSSNAYSVIQPTASNQPTLAQRAQNSLPGIQFTSNFYLYQAATSMPNFTTGGSTSVLIAARNANNNDSWNIINTIWFDIAGLSATLRYHFSFNQNATDGTTLYTNSSLVGQVTSNAVAPSANAILGFTASATSQTIHTNGSTNSYPGTTLPDATGNTDFIFNDARNNAASANTMIFEMVGYNTQITTAQRQLLEGYLAWKWGLVAQLPTDHPYKTTSIPSLPPFPNAPRLPTLTNNPVFSPLQISNCYLWLDAADTSQVVLSAGTSNITQWNDKSPNRFHATAAGNPTYNSSSYRVQFNGTTSYLSNLAYSLNLSQRSIFIVMSENSRTTAAGVFSHIPNPRSGLDYTTTNGFTIETSNGLRFYGNSGGYLSDMGSSVLLAQAIYNDNMNGTQGSSFLNGSNTSNNSANYTAGTCSGYVLGARWLGVLAGPYLNGTINEIIVYNSPVTVSQRQQIEGYLAWKWNLTGSLITTQPYKAPPLAPFSYAVRRATQNSWTPLNITGCSLWLDASDPATLTFSGLNVTQWRDKSGLSNNASNSGNIQNTGQIGKLAAMVYTGAANTYFTGPVTNSGTTLSVFSVFVMNSSSYSAARIVSLAKPATFDFNNTLYTAPILRRTAQLGAFRNLSDLSVIATTFGTPYVFSSVYTGSSNTVYANGTTGTTVASSGNFGYTNYEIGGSFGEENVAVLNGLIGEVLHYTTFLSDSQRQQVEGYLAWKWGLQGTLPPNHPYKLFPPSP
jgi:hypothetical protein